MKNFVKFLESWSAREVNQCARACSQETIQIRLALEDEAANFRKILENNLKKFEENTLHDSVPVGTLVIKTGGL